MSWFEKIMPSRIKTERRTRSVPEGLWIKCPACDAVLAYTFLDGAAAHAGIELSSQTPTPVGDPTTAQAGTLRARRKPTRELRSTAK